MVNNMIKIIMRAYLTSPPPVEVGQYPEDKHGGYGDSVTTLLQHYLITINNLKQSMHQLLNFHTQSFGYSCSIWSGRVTGEGRDGWLMC
jgi:hypothetical protein